MHQQVFDWIAAQAPRLPGRGLSVLEVGSLDINGSVRPLFPDAVHYHGLDLVAGPGVDEVADASTWTPPRTYDLVVCAEVLEHAPPWRAILDMMWAATAPGGTLLMTCATDPRAPHSAVDGLDVRAGEHYENVSGADVRDAIAAWVDPPPTSWALDWAADRGDLYLRAGKPR